MVSAIYLEVTGKVSVVVNPSYNTNHVNAGKITGSGPWSVVNAGIYSHSSGVGAVPVMDFEEKLQL